MENKNKKIIILIIVGVFVISVAAIIGVSVNNKSKSQAQSTASTSITTNANVETTTKATTTQTTTKSTTVKDTNKKEIETEIIVENGTSRVVHYPNGKPAQKPNKPNGGYVPNYNPDTNAKPDTMPTQPGAKPLNAQEKQWVIDNYFMEFKNHGALPNFFVKDNGSENGLTRKTILNNKNYKERINAYKNDCLPGSRTLIKGEAENCKYVRYWFTEENGQTVLYYKPVKG